MREGEKKLFADSQAVKRRLIELLVLHGMSGSFQQTPLHQLFTFLIKQQARLGLFLPREPERCGFVSPEEHFWKRLEEGTSFGASGSNNLWCNRVSS